MKRQLSHLERAMLSLGLIGGLLLWAQSSAAFTSQKTATLTARATVGGVVPAVPIRIEHIELRGASPVGGYIVIQGGAGTSPSSNADLPSRIRPFGVIRAQDDPPEIRVRLEYRVLGPGGFPLDPTPVVMGPIEGPDPLNFRFDIPAEALTGSGFEYKIVAERISTGAIVTLPAQSGPEEFISINTVASAANAFGAAGGRLTLFDGNPNDGEARVDIPAGRFSEPRTVTLVQVPVDSLPPLGALGPAFSAYEFKVDPALSSALSLTLLYPDWDPNDPNGQKGTFSGTNIPESNASVAWWDGFIWRKLGGVVNAARNTISLNAGNYNLLAIVASAAPTPTERRAMEKIITPNGDNKNDTAPFLLSGTGATVEIFDVSGDRIRTLQEGNYDWDGRDESGKIVESGVYIYQYEVEGERVSGVIAVAK